MLMCVSGLLSLMYIETIALVLEVTDKSNSAPLSFSRYLSTLNHTLAWYRSVQTFSLIFLMINFKFHSGMFLICSNPRPG